MNRDQNIQKISWFWDLRQRELLDLDPPYQRRSVWTQEYRDYFIDTILLNYPAPAIFLFEQTSPIGTATYHVVDGKQRLTTVFDFVSGKFPVGDKAQYTNLRGLYFSEFTDDQKRAFWSYKFSVEYIPSADEGIISAIFDRINRNVAKLSPQELRHAKYDGVFIASAEESAELMSKALPADFPRIASGSKKHMKDVEFAAELLLFLEAGPRNYTQLELDEVFSLRDKTWDTKDEIEAKFRATIESIKRLVATNHGAQLLRTRLRNQADFYALFAAIASFKLSAKAADEAAARLLRFVEIVDDDAQRAHKANGTAREYYEAARSSSNDIGQRRKRIEVLQALIAGEAHEVDNDVAKTPAGVESRSAKRSKRVAKAKPAVSGRGKQR